MNIAHLTATQLRNAFYAGELSAQEITSTFLQRIKEYDGQLGAFLTVFGERAQKKASELDAKRARGETLGKLAGIPVALKDNIHVKGELTTCASKFLSNYRAVFDATVTTLIENEDGIILGKTNLDEFAMGSSTENSAFQKTCNPWAPQCVPGGSSGGSAVAVAARLCPIAFGSDTGGSIRQPASLCGVVGYKPTYGRISRSGLVAFGSSLDQIGPFANSTEDIGLMMEVLGKHCPNDSTSISDPPEEYLRHYLSGIKGMKIGVPWHFVEGVQEETLKNFSTSIELLQTLGAEIIPINLDILKHSIDVYYILATAEAATNLARFDGIQYGVRSPQARTLQEVYDYSKEEGFGTEVKRRILLGTYVLASGFKDAYYRKAQQVRTLMLRAFQNVFSSCHLIAMPVSPFPAFEIGAIQDPIQMYLADIFTIGANLGGLPAISVPSGFNHEGKPLGLQLLGPQRHDVAVCKAAHAFEQAAHFSPQIPPQFN